MELTELINSERKKRYLTTKLNLLQHIQPLHIVTTSLINKLTSVVKTFTAETHSGKICALDNKLSVIIKKYASKT